ncbi:MAG: hypothetical protein KatS3mg090_0694 [Patescibacteria group bacterium]|nr:MAG: hypothetical protein KatS3mg090_0694 [Patescibacteria group bacterium]
MFLKLKTKKSRGRPRKKSNIFKKISELNIKAVFVIFLIFILFVLSYFLYNRFFKFNFGKSKEEILLNNLKQHIILNDNEVPTIATVTDEAKLKNQEFFKMAKNGDVVFIFTESRKAILYRPSIDKIIEVAPVRSVQEESNSDKNANIVKPQSQQTEQLTNNNNTTDLEKQSEPNLAKLILLNGTQTVGVTNQVEEKLGSFFNDSYFKVVSKDFAQYRDYKNTVVVLLNPSFEDYAKKIAQVLSADLTNTMPEFETASLSADIVVIVGASQ